MSPNELILVPSLLAADHARLAAGADMIADCGLPWAHLDIMDGHFVPNLTFGPQVLADLNKHRRLFYDTHLMLDEPHRYIEPFAKAGAGLISIQAEPDYPIAETLAEIRRMGCQNGIVFNPGTPAAAVEPYIGQVDLVLIMTVPPGCGGQPFREDTLPKIEQLHQWREQRGLNFRLEVDGGINPETARRCRARGADTFVAGTAFFTASDKPGFLRQILARG